MKARIVVATILMLVPYLAPPGQAQTRAVSIDQLVAPIALYPDALIAQILLSAADPAQVQEFDRWLTANNKALSGSNLQDAAVKAGFEASLVALALFPQVVRQMASDLNWTKTLGGTFAVNQDLIFDSIQKLRRQAQSVGTLKTTPQQEVTTQTTSSGEQVIIIEPANPQVVYVPQYNPQVVYTQAPSTTTVVIQEDDDDWEEAVAAGVIGFTAGVAISSFYNPYYYGGYGWYGGGYMYNDGWDDYIGSPRGCARRLDGPPRRHRGRPRRQGRRSPGKPLGSRTRTARRTGLIARKTGPTAGRTPSSSGPTASRADPTLALRGRHSAASQARRRRVRRGSGPRVRAAPRHADTAAAPGLKARSSAAAARTRSQVIRAVHRSGRRAPGDSEAVPAAGAAGAGAGKVRRCPVTS